MAKISIKKATLQKVSDALEQRYGQRKRDLPEEFIETLIYQILELGASERAASQALERIQAEYIDWNDMRVATIREIQDILGPKYPRCREKAEDLASLLADLYTAFRSMQLSEVAPQPQGVETLRALPETTLIREDMVEQALLVSCRMHTFPCDHDQMELLRFFKAVPADMAFGDAKYAIEQELDNEQLLRLSHGLREHVDFIQQHEEYDPQPISWGWTKDCPITKAKAKKVSRPQPKIEKVPHLVAPPPKPEPTPEELAAAEAEAEATVAAIEEKEDAAAEIEKAKAQQDTGTESAPEPVAAVEDKPTDTVPEKPAKKAATSNKKVAAKTKAPAKMTTAAKKKTAAKKPAAKKAPAKKTTAAKKKTAAKKPAAKKAPAKKTTAAKKKTAAKKPVAKKAPAKKKAAVKKKAPAKKPAAKKAPAKKKAAVKKKKASKKKAAKKK